jgi:hypothetical protein
LTETGATVLRLYHDAVARTEQAISDPAARIEALLQPRRPPEPSGGK